ncbi:hypothetical protein [Brumimicrobium aurantiacum]|uniref:Uncharacterized protein n=1 Tax=Brumimicrobium aurantiacum TaxID=1737063 RepID=A0A3E1EZT0_9FLAO|nr:hypothetical protein [Brumimicrobium aurantiacum]RFC55070.1 hypothetical protein DXU93_04415 [Brumimicrobium aurantiacum]
MSKNTDKPSPEAKALSLFLMAHKSTNQNYKEKSKRINKLWTQVASGGTTKEVYLEEVQNMLESYGGYDKVVEKTVQFYINKTGEWKLAGNDKFCQDAQKIADRLKEEK